MSFEGFMNIILEHLAHRRSVKPLEMHGPGPSADELTQLLTIAARVPDHGKLAPWRFIVLEGEGRLRAGEVLAKIYSADHPEADAARTNLERQRFSHAPLVVAVVSKAAPHVKIPLWEQELSAGAVCMNLTVAATAMGYRTAWLTDWFAYDRRALSGLGLAETEKIAGFIHIGRSDSNPEDRDRPDLSQIVTKF
jgi:nitroreductase